MRIDDDGSRRRRHMTTRGICAPLLLALVAIWVAYTSVTLYQNQDDLRLWMNSAVPWRLSTRPTHADQERIKSDGPTAYSIGSEVIPVNQENFLFQRENFPKQVENFPEDEENFPKQSQTDISSEAETPHIPFGSLRLCSKDTGLFYSCENDPTCLSPTCVTRNRTSVFTDPDKWRRFYETATERRRVLREILDRMPKGRSSQRVMLMAFNSGFAHLFGNWYCGLLANLPLDQVDRIKRETLVLATDEDAISYVRSLGFFTPSKQDIDVLMEWTRQGTVQRKPSIGFGMGGHGLLNLVLKIAMPLDLIDMYYTVVIQDADLVWTQNVLDELDNYCSPETCDAVFIQESRDFIAKRELDRTESWRRNRTTLDYPGYKEANTGLFLLRPKRAIRTVLRTLIEGNRLQQWKSRDQLLWNSLLHHKAFQDSVNLNFNLLPKNRFVPGKYLRRQHLANWTLPSTPELIALHASDTSSYREKYKRLKPLGHWYFNEATCAEPVRKCMQMNETCYAPVEDSIAEYQKFLATT